MNLIPLKLSNSLMYTLKGLFWHKYRQAAIPLRFINGVSPPIVLFIHIVVPPYPNANVTKSLKMVISLKFM